MNNLGIPQGSNQLLLSSVLGSSPHEMEFEELQNLCALELQRITTSMLNLRAVKQKVREPSPKAQEKARIDSRIAALMALGGLTMDEVLNLGKENK